MTAPGIAYAAAQISLGRHIVLRDVDLVLHPGTLTAMVGPNGAGKSTLLRALAGLLPQTRRPADPRRVAWLPQGARCAWGLTVAQLATLGRIPHRDQAAAPVEAALRRCGVWHLADRRIDRVSGGQARRAMLARALATEPQALLLDEPLADLDPAAQHDIMRLLRQLADTGMIVVIVLHMLDLLADHADRVLVLEAGRIVADAAPALALPRAAAAFGMRWASDAAPRLLP